MLGVGFIPFGLLSYSCIVGEALHESKNHAICVPVLIGLRDGNEGQNPQLLLLKTRLCLDSPIEDGSGSKSSVA